MGIKWTTGNTKLAKENDRGYNILGFGIPADYVFVDKQGATCNTCPGACACKGVCYAKQGRYNMPNVRDARVRNLTESLGDTFVLDATDDLRYYKRRGYNVIRLHDSGDFYSQEYLDKWAAIAHNHPDLIFYAYTKNLLLTFDAVPANLRIVQSLGGLYDKLVNLEKPHSRIFSSDMARIMAGYVDGNTNDIPAIEGVIRIGLVYHGVRKLTVAQNNFFA